MRPTKAGRCVDLCGRGRSALPPRQQSFCYPNQKALYDWLLLQGIVFAYAHRVGGNYLPQGLEYVCGMTAIR
jgi:hypothetical protein